MDFVNFDLAKKLKEEGFNLHCEPFYALENFIAEYVDICGDCYEVDFEKGILYLNYPLQYKTFEEKMLPAPTISQVFKWLREKKEVDLVIEPIFCYDKNIHREYGVRVFAPSLNKPTHCGYFNMWEKAAIAGIEYALDNLI